MTTATAPAPAAARTVDGSFVHRARRLYIDSGQEAVVYLHRDSQLCRSEGFESETRLWVRIGSRAVLATLNVITGELLAVPEVGLSESAWARLGAADGSIVEFALPLPLESLRLPARVGNRAEAGQPLFTLHAEAKGELEYAMAYATGGGEIIAIEENV